mmetsp:Transcript_15584/g.30598  ORF Transcript_15584/g.30598 Transcript_15584/m.30598 type:complete len:269 (+) Transcript_15584:18-824(+)
MWNRVVLVGVFAFCFQLDYYPRFLNAFTLVEKWTFEFALFFYCAGVAQITKTSVRGKFWLHGVVIQALTAFGGGILVPVLLNSLAPFPLTNDFALPSILLTWWLTHCCPGDVWNKLVEVPLVHDFVFVVFEICRCKLTLHWLTVAQAVITKPTAFAAPVAGPIICGTLGGSAGVFMPFDKGLAAISSSVPWVMESAFLASTFFFFSTSGILTNWAGSAALQLDKQSAHVAVGMGLVVFRVFPELLATLQPLRMALYKLSGVTPPVKAK